MVRTADVLLPCSLEGGVDVIELRLLRWGSACACGAWPLTDDLADGRCRLLTLLRFLRLSGLHVGLGLLGSGVLQVAEDHREGFRPHTHLHGLLDHQPDILLVSSAGSETADRCLEDSVRSFRFSLLLQPL